MARALPHPPGPGKNNHNQDALAMKLSDKALRLIGRSLLQGRDARRQQDGPQNTLHNSFGSGSNGARPAPLVNPPHRATGRTAAVVPFRRRRPQR